MSRRKQRSKLCPTPSKTPYWTEEEACERGTAFEAQIAQAHRPGASFYVYLCDCRRYHLTHHKVGRNGRYNRKASHD